MEEMIIILRSEYEQMKRKIVELRSIVQQLKEELILLRGGGNSRTSSTTPSQDIGRSNVKSFRGVKRNRMKRIICIYICIFLFLIDVACQITFIPPFPKDVSDTALIDSGRIRIWYALNALNINNPETFDDLQRLEIGTTSSKYFSHFVYTSDSLCTDWGKKNKGAQSFHNWMGPKMENEDLSKLYWSEYFKDFS